MRWQTRQQYVNLETGEILGPKDAQTNYYIVRRTRTIIHDKKTNTYTKLYINQCRIKPTQNKLW